MVPIESMRVKELQVELKGANVDYSDCFDKESLVQRLADFRNGKIQPKLEEKTTSTATTTSSTATPPKSAPATKSSKQPFVKENKLQELRSMKVRELREECAKRRIRWAQFVEKEELVQALIESMERSADFSVSGVMMPGEVTDLTAEQLEAELSQPSEAPLLLDIYATWCGPCQSTLA